MEEKKTSSLKKIKRGLRRRTIFFLVLAIMANAFAWFIYSNKVSNSINAGVKSWRITFSQDGTDIENNVVFNVDSIYPGMTNYTDSFEISNSGEMAAVVTYEILSAKIFDDIYTTDDYTSEEIEDILENDYPFTITFEVENANIDVYDSTTFSVNIVWPYESGNDTLDTFWGKESYTFKQENPGENEIELLVKVVAGQVNE